MLRKWLGKLLGNSHDKTRGSRHRPYRSSDDYVKRSDGGGTSHNRLQQYGHTHYKKKRSSSSYSS
ncbi:hypothetical protein [Paenibacillus piri]|uniref:Uncharacterized protein n=1 Tax=Paenibacillus piri TaxID=2547395 RepID=A0A4R5KJ58_9BACL|nr:hypothetical protein [Paenibacillus piri]TDF94477.1 hypothetical protein E1757_24020 [Paenibacillus piri]